MLISKPQRNPASVGLLRVLKIPKRVADRDRNTRSVSVGKLRQPGSPGAYGVGGQIRTAAIEWEMTPASQKRRDSAVAILPIEKPADTLARRFPCLIVHIAEVSQRDQRSGRVVGVRDSTGQIRPRPASGCSVRIRVLVL